MLSLASYLGQLLSQASKSPSPVSPAFAVPSSKQALIMLWASGLQDPCHRLTLSHVLGMTSAGQECVPGLRYVLFIKRGKCFLMAVGALSSGGLSLRERKVEKQALCGDF